MWACLGPLKYTLAYHSPAPYPGVYSPWLEHRTRHMCETGRKGFFLLLEKSEKGRHLIWSGFQVNLLVKSSVEWAQGQESATKRPV